MNDSIYQNHPIHTVVKQLIELQQDEDLVAARLALSEDQTWEMDRVFEIARVVESYLENTPSTLVSSASLSNIQSYLQQALSELSSYRNNKNSGHLTNANSHVESTILQLSGFARPPDKVTEEVIGKVVGDLRQRSIQAVKTLTAMKDALAAEIDSLRETANAQEQRIAELTNAVDVQKKEAIAVSAEVRATYSKVEAELRGVFGGALEAMKTSYLSLEQTTSIAAKNTLTELNKKQEEARKIVQVVGNIGVTGNYQNTASSEATAANTMRGLTLAFFAIGVIVAMAALLAHLFPGVSPIKITDGGPWELALRLITALAIATPALYTARESARHRTNSDRAKQRELELASLGPFIELLPQEKKDEIVAKLTDRYFGSHVESHEVKPILDPKDAVELAKQAIDGLVKIAK